MTEPILRVHELTKHFPIRRGLFGRASATLRAVDGVSFDVHPGETVGIVGESGCGKSTLARTLMWLDEPTSGSVTFDGQPVSSGATDLLRRQMQIVFQDPYTSLPPRMTIGDIVADPIRIHGTHPESEIRSQVNRLLTEVGVSAQRAGQYPFQFSGGQRQRIGIARALAIEPRLLILDEAVSALDVSVQGQILNLLQDLQDQHGLAYLFISHDLGVVRYLSDRVLVMYLGKIVEEGPAEALYAKPHHPYTQALLSAVPTLRGRRSERVRLRGEPPKPTSPPSGCAFHPRCPMAQPICAKETPLLLPSGPGRRSACHFSGQLAGNG
ncbi:MAG: ATP-binding cassette domain-containing protein [Thermomicrobiales bacterium]|nr:ATP-binding cassette domain-containing protein [Thermomicrobiales bacterium]